jgi:dihydropteroate synthase
MLHSQILTIGKRDFNWGSKTYLMGILNITPDSFSGDGLYQTADSSGELDINKLVDTALTKARGFADAGADIIDIGGESTRPGADIVDLKTEMERVVPVVESLVQEIDLPISIDTYKHQIAEAALEAGADMVNDVWGLNADPEMGTTITRYGVPVILMHNRSSWAHADIKESLGGRYIGIPYDNLIKDIKRELLESVELAHTSGIPDGRIILDPGIGFGKTVDQNLELINRMQEIRELGYPLLYGPSRKSFIGYTLDKPPHERLAGTAASIAVGILRGADIIRVHDVDFMKQVATMTDAIVR